MSAGAKTLPAIARRAPIRGGVRPLDWQRLAADLDAQGSAVVEGLLGAEECHALSALRASGHIAAGQCRAFESTAWPGCGSR
jgi:hypothetical protein